MTYHITDNAFWQSFRKIIQVQKSCLDKLVVGVVQKLSHIRHRILHNYLPVFRIRKLLLRGEL